MSTTSRSPSFSGTRSRSVLLRRSKVNIGLQNNFFLSVLLFERFVTSSLNKLFFLSNQFISIVPLGINDTIISMSSRCSIGLDLLRLGVQFSKIFLKSLGLVLFRLFNNCFITFSSILGFIALCNVLTSSFIIKLLSVVAPSLSNSSLRVGLASLRVSIELPASRLLRTSCCICRSVTISISTY